MTRVEVRNGSRRRVAEVDTFGDGKTVLECTARWSGLGEWKLTLPARSYAAQALTFAGGIIVDRGGPLPFLSGRVVDLDTKEELEGQHVLVASGVTDEYLLANRIVLPPRTAAGGFGAYDDRTGTAESLMRGVVSRNAGPEAEAARRYADLELEPDQGRGTTLRMRRRYDGLLVTLQELGRAGGVGFRVVQVGTARRLVLSVPRDRSRAIVFGFDRGNLKSLRYRTTAPTGTYVYAGGQGELEARQIVEGSDPTAITAFGGGAEGRVEVFLDERSAEDEDYLRQQILEALVDRSASSALTVEPVEGPDAVFGETGPGGFDLGDVVSVRDRQTNAGGQTGAVFLDRVQEAKLTIDVEGVETLRPVVASEGATLSGLNIVDNMRRMNRRLTRLETGA